MFSHDLSLPAPTIHNLLEQDELRWVFVGGKGGVGKTTCSCCIAVQLAKMREKVLILSTDPAHNLSDAFDQKFSKSPIKVKGFSNLYAMEIDPNLSLGELEKDLVGTDEAAMSADIRRTIAQLMSTIPGVDEYMAYTEVFRLVRGLDYSVVVFDTAPTGHTLRLLSFPETMEKSLGKIVALKNQFAPLMSSMMSFLGMNNTQSEDVAQALESRLPIVREITQQFKDPNQTTFVCVCIPEFLSMYETERLVQELTAHEIDVHNVIVNQMLFPHLSSSCSSEEDGGIHSGDHVINSFDSSDRAGSKPPPTSCRMCLARHKIQSKYLEQILELYEDMHVIQLPLLEEEIRGVESVQSFAKHLIKPYRR